MPSAAPQLFLIDGYALIYRAFFAMIARPLTTSRGENTSAAWGVTNFLLRLFEKYHPPYIVWVHDSGTSFRHETYPQYKATREKLDAQLQQDFDWALERIERLLTAFHVPLVTVPGYEADDVIGTLVARADERGFHSVIVSGDKDFYQLLSPTVSLLNPGRGGAAAVEEQWVDLGNARERFGVAPERVVDFLALVGDSSDNVPGVKGVGDKTATQLIETYGDLESILANAGSVTGKRAREALLAGAESARLSRQLVTIKRDVPLDADFESFRASPPDTATLRQLFTELEFHSLVAKLEVSAPVATAEPVRVVRDPAGMRALVERVRKTGSVVIAVLAGGPDPIRDACIGISLSLPGGESWYLPLAHRAPAELGAVDPVNLPALGTPDMTPVADLLRDASVAKVGHDLKHAWLALRKAGVELAGVAFDVMLASFVLDPGRRAHTLDVLAVDHLGLTLAADSDLVGKGKTVRPVAEVSPEEAAAHITARGAAIHRLHDFLAPQLSAMSLRGLVDDLELPLVPVLVDMEWRGIRIDTAGLAALSSRFTAELAEIERSIYREAGTDFNINSTPQLRHVLFEKLQLPMLKKTKTGPSTDADVLEELGRMGFPVPALLLEYRELTKLKSTYVDVLPHSVNPATGRIHTSFNQAGAATGRLSSSEPNLQNIPIRTARGELIRTCFVPAEGHRFIVADYSQIELRLLAHLSSDEAFIEAFRRGGDIHRETAAIIFDVAAEGVTPEMRARAKTINFATIYGQGPFALSKQLTIPLDDAKEFIRKYFERFAGVRRFLDHTIEQARTRGYVETIFGRRRYIPELKDPNYNVRSFGERTAMNSPMQGSAADLIKRAMIGIHRSFGESRLTSGMLLQVHDELVLEAPLAEIDAASAIVRHEMENAAALSVPLVVDVGVGDNWLEAKGQ